MNLDSVPPIDEYSERVKQIRRNLELHDTKFLLYAWVNNDKEEWTSEAFEAIREILIERLGEVPAQKTKSYLEEIEPLERIQKLHFSWIEGEITFRNLNEENANILLDRINTAILKESTCLVTRERNKLSFEVPYFRFIWNTSFLVGINSGEFRVQNGLENKLVYKFSFLRRYIMTLVFISICTIPMLINSSKILVGFALYASVFYAVATIIGYFISAYRLREFVRRTITKENS